MTESTKSRVKLSGKADPQRCQTVKLTKDQAKRIVALARKRGVTFEREYNACLTQGVNIRESAILRSMAVD